MKTSYKNEKEFQKDYINWLKDEGYRVYKLPDVGYSLKPCDIFAVKEGKSYCIELKHGRVDTYERIYKKLRPNQIGGLLHHQQHGGISRVVGRDNKTNKIYSYEFTYEGSNMGTI